MPLKELQVVVAVGRNETHGEQMLSKNEELKKRNVNEVVSCWSSYLDVADAVGGMDGCRLAGTT